MDEKKETFTYTYSAKEQEEIRKIRSKYAPPAKGENSIEQLRRLDESAISGIVSYFIQFVRWVLRSHDLFVKVRNIYHGPHGIPG